MSTISASMVKELREQTGAGMMDCKQALSETGGDMSAAVDWLRKKGLSKAAKKSGRVAAEGLVAVASAPGIGSVVEVNSETDFVARNDTFQSIVSDIAKLALAVGGDVEALKAATMPGKAITVDDHIKEMIGSIGENMNLRRSAVLSVSEGVVATYVHNKVVDDAGKIGVLVALESKADAGRLTALGRQIAMHIAAFAPLALTADELDPDAIAKERAIYLEQAKSSGKPQEIIEKMVEGRLRKEFFAQVVLLQQSYAMDPKKTVEQVVGEASKELGAPVKIAAFRRLALGEGIERETTDFAAEVAAAAGGSR
ncbi:MAG: translation elongation factor Ts [Hyphomicrobiaceae bacterium]